MAPVYLLQDLLPRALPPGWTFEGITSVGPMQMATYTSVTGLRVNVSYETYDGKFGPHLHCSIGRADRLPSETEIKLVSSIFAPMSESRVLKSFQGARKTAPFVWHVLISILAPIAIGSN